jgi:hypothetical protein
MIILLLTLISNTTYSQILYKNNKSDAEGKTILPQDTTKQVTKEKKISLGGIFLSAGTGISVPIHSFQEYSNVSFGILSRLEYSSSAIFPFVIGAEIDYFKYIGSDNYKTINLLAGLQTKIFSYGLTIEYVLSKLFSSSYTIPYLTLDVKNNSINREYDLTADLPLSRKESKISIGFGFGFTLFIFDFYTKYNYMKDVSNFGVYMKVKIPVIRF